MKEYLIEVKVNDGDTGELVEKVRFIQSDEDGKFEDADALLEHISSEDFEKFDDIVDEHREYEREESDVYRVSVVELVNE